LLLFELFEEMVDFLHEGEEFVVVRRRLVSDRNGDTDPA
jgi:hypothetical protein